GELTVRAGLLEGGPYDIGYTFGELDIRGGPVARFRRHDREQRDRMTAAQQRHGDERPDASRLELTRMQVRRALLAPGIADDRRHALGRLQGEQREGGEWKRGDFDARGIVLA